MKVSSFQDRLRLGRRDAAAGSEVKGLDHVEALKTDEDRWKLTMYFVPPASGGPAVPDGIGPGNLRITREDGTVLPGVWVSEVEVPEPGGVLLASVAVEDRALAARLAGDPARYGVELVDLLPEVEGQMDRHLRRGHFSWSDPGAGGLPVLPAQLPELPLLADINYLAKDFQSFRKLMLDRMAMALPAWQERNAVDLGVAIVEVLAYAADQLSYYQDAVATEAYLETARQRTSVRRHVRLLDYFLHEGCNSRVWLELEVDRAKAEVVLPAGTEVLTGSRQPGALEESSEAYRKALAEGAQVFETLYDAILRGGHNRFRLHSWGLAGYVIPAGETRAALVGKWSTLRKGDVLVLRQVRSPETGEEQDADPRRAHVVRLAAPPTFDSDGATEITEISWNEEDALRFPLWISRESEGWSRSDLAEVFGNVVLADHGRTIVEELPPVPAHGRFAPVLGERNLVHAVPFDAAEASILPAVAGTFQDPAQAVPVLALYELSERYFYRHAEEEPAAKAAASIPGLESMPDAEEPKPARAPRARPSLPGRGRFDRVFKKKIGIPLHEMPHFEVWTPRKDLLWSGRFDRHFVVETEAGHARLRFGDGFQGLSPAPGSRLWAVYRVGSPVRGNVGPGMVTQAVVEEGLGVIGAHNCVPARGGTLPEDVETVRRHAPQAFHSQRRCVTEEDFVTLARGLRGVWKAQCVKSWNGSGVTAILAVQRAGGLQAGGDFLRRVDAALRPYLIVGHELEVRPPDLVPLRIVLAVEVASGHLRNPIRDDLLRLLGDHHLTDGRVGFFHPDNFTFGQPVYLSDLIALAMSVHGVASVEVLEFHRWGRPQGGEIEAGRIEMDRLEIALCRNDPAHPRLGELELRLRGGQ